LILWDRLSLSRFSGLAYKSSEDFSQYKPHGNCQGDTLTAAMIAWAAFIWNKSSSMKQVFVLNLAHPFPEEANRAYFRYSFFAFTLKLAYETLLQEGVEKEKIHITGNTGIDAFLEMLKSPIPENIEKLVTKWKSQNKKIVLLTAHRRENEGEPVRNWFATLLKFLEKHSDVIIIYPMHPNLTARPLAEKMFKGHPQIELFAPFNYKETAHLLKNCSLVVTDSGGIQEEAATLGIPTVVCRETTERMEAVHAGIAELVGTDPRLIELGMEKALGKETLDKRQILFGDGESSLRIALIIKKELSKQ
jgi:UDP-N-acetylglucosamine 2-epimerase (non-hydrolysing)